MTVLPRLRAVTAVTRSARAGRGLLALLSLLVVLSAWACGTRTLDVGTGLSSPRAVTASADAAVQGPGEATDRVRPGSSQCEAPGTPPPCKKVLLAQPDVRLLETAEPVARTAALAATGLDTLSADVCRDVVTSGLSPPAGRAVPDRMRI
ncbi:hypothetical protein [Streptomyces sp. SudanB91_2054]|uniref:hypothetical protein n=1 Tax=Streptomyces sp. SudanB91_2054 TaxID=3035278 RepID=UPI0036DED3BA